MRLEQVNPIDFSNVFHPTDGGVAGDRAFAHALKIALVAQGRLTILHSEDGLTHGSPRHALPHVRETLERWGYLPPHSERAAVAELGVHIEKIAVIDTDPVAASLKYLDRHPHNVLVMATHQYDGLERLMHKTVAEPLARQAGAAALFLPQNCDGFVNVESGAVCLRHILIPVATQPAPAVAVKAALKLVQRLSLATMTHITLLHVGEAGGAPLLRLPAGEAWQFEQATRSGDVVEEILRATHEFQVDLVVMATAGHHGLLDALRGSTTERILRRVEVPLLAVPVADDHDVQLAPVWSLSRA